MLSKLYLLHIIWPVVAKISFFGTKLDKPTIISIPNGTKVVGSIDTFQKHECTEEEGCIDHLVNVQ